MGLRSSGDNRPYTELPFSLILRFRSRILQSIRQRTSRLNELPRPNFSRTSRTQPEHSLKFQFQPLAIRVGPLWDPGGRDGGSQGPAQIFPEVANLEDSGWAPSQAGAAPRNFAQPVADFNDSSPRETMRRMGWRRFRRVRRFISEGS